MYANQKDLVSQFLDTKNYQKYVPESYNISGELKDRVLFMKNRTLKHEIEVMNFCVSKCFSDMETAIVTDSESTCMSNCNNKGIEMLQRMNFASASQ
jgi:hypothetical protein